MVFGVLGECFRCNFAFPNPCAKVREYIHYRVIVLRHGCVCSDKYVFRTYKEISNIMGMHVN